jgi:hypothetical protein
MMVIYAENDHGFNNLFLVGVFYRGKECTA